MSYTRPPALDDSPTWVGDGPYTRPDATSDEVSFAPLSSGGGTGGSTAYQRPDALVDIVSWQGDGVYERPSALQDEVSFVPPTEPGQEPSLVVEFLVETASISGSPTLGLRLDLESISIVTGEAEGPSAFADIEETGVITGGVDEYSWVLVDEVASMEGVATGIVRTSDNIVENLRIRDELITTKRIVYTSAASATISDSSSVRIIAVVRETTRLRPQTVPRTFAAGALVSRATIRGFGFTQTPAFVTDSAIAGVVTHARVRSPINIVAAVRVEGSAESRALVRRTQNDTSTAYGLTLNNVWAKNDAVSRVFIFGSAAPAGGPAQIWTANTWSWGMSTYTDLPLQEMTKDMAVGPSGLYFPDTSPVPVRVTTGETDFGHPMKKRVPWFYMSGNHKKPLTLTVSATSGAARISVSYEETRRSAETDRTTRVQIGKGFNSNFYQFTISGESPMVLHECEAVVVPSSRRI